ncbi:four-carbon acid sugar kinase family protein [Paenibacillus harenae]|uniref:four-carbon acid sugar kinase family protein n=1 Tax=Paenibacillus harenae TaxID=306543 RepID=UPI0004286E8B|nr:four-carbon acid sugar kinase family protein [Paenibacillus harenae]
MIGVVADDITGAGDIGIMFAKARLETHVYPLQDWEDSGRAGARPDVLIIDTNSRLNRPEDAYEKVFRATKALLGAGCGTFYNKTCSVFRGNIGAEFDAMLDALGASFALVALGFPKTGRTTLGGIHYVRGTRLEESEFRHDPVHPMTRSDLVQILQAQTSRKVDRVDIRTVDAGSERLREEIARKKKDCCYLIVDVRDQASLRIIAEAAKDEPVLCGSSALAEELALLDRYASSSTRSAGQEENAVTQLPAEQAKRCNVLCVAGSLMPQTAAQTQYIREKGIRSAELDSLLLIDPQLSGGHMRMVASYAVQQLEAGEDVLVYASNQKEKVAETKRRALQQGMDNTEVSRIVSDALSEVVKDICGRTGQRQIVVAGGETSAAVCGKLGITGFRIWKEIEPGLPSCESLEPRRRLFVLKSGSFGGEDFLWKAIEHLKAEGGRT